LTQTATVIRGGPAGLMAAEVLARAGVAVTIFDQMPSVGRKFLMAGRGGLNLTHAEPLAVFLSRYGAAREWLEPMIAAFPPETPAILNSGFADIFGVSALCSGGLRAGR
jgi:predicted flavoprotein YhiN